VKLTDDVKNKGPVAIMSLKGELVALAKSQADAKWIINANKGEVAAPDRVIMHPDTYPKHWTSSEQTV
jgi:H/ACA ribonucleoprotein complex subunit 4